MASDITLRDDEKVLVTPTYTDDQGNPAAAPTNPTAVSDNTALTLADNGDGTWELVTTGALIDPASPATITLSGDGIVTPAVFTADVVVSAAVSEAATFGTPEKR